MKIGTKVGAERWPYSHAHPDCWMQPWHGWLLAVNDTRAWVKTIAFPSRKPNQAKVDEHVSWCHAQGLLDANVPVFWIFGAEKTVHWERLEALVPYQVDVQNWRRARAAAYLGQNEGALELAV